LMIVIAILGILVAIGIPQFLIFQSKAKRTEGISILQATRISEEVYYTSNDTYTLDELKLLELKWIQEIPKYYIYFFQISSDQPKQGIIVEVRGNIDKDYSPGDLDWVVLIHGDPGPMALGYKPGIYIIHDDIIN